MHISHFARIQATLSGIPTTAMHFGTNTDLRWQRVSVDSEGLQGWIFRI